MFVVVQHKISDPKSFWSLAEKVLPELPKGMKVVRILPNTEGNQAVCLWEAPSVDSVRQIIDPAAGHVSKNEYFAVDDKKAFGLVD